MKPSYYPGVTAGALTGAVLTITLLSCLYAGWQAAGLPFVPFDVFDWFARHIPGAVIGFTISTMVLIIGALHIGPTSATAKAIEQAMGIFGLFFTGVIAGAVLFGILRPLRGRLAYLLGLAVGAVVGISATLISINLTRTAEAASAVWILCIFLLWGAGFGWVYRRLSTTYHPSALPAEISPETEIRRISRRKFLIRLGGAAATITVSGAVVGALAGRYRNRPTAAGLKKWSDTHLLPNAGAAVKPAPGTRPEYTPLEKHYRIDINTIPPSIEKTEWRLRITGLVEEPLSMTLTDIRNYEPMHQFITLACISNPVGGDLVGTIRWTGVSLLHLLPRLRIRPEATHLKIRSADGFYETFSLADIRSDERIMLTYEWDGVPLLREHGFPLRIYIPDLYGMKQPKWIESIEAIDGWEPGYWVVRGWDRVARMKAASVIDTVAVNHIIRKDGQALVPIGGISRAGVRGISRVEVQVDDEPWKQAALRTPLSKETWVIWRFEWPFQAGRHKFTVRCFEGDGTPQIATPSPPDPSGATGLDSKTIP